MIERAASSPERPPVPVEVDLARALQEAGRASEGRVWLEAYVSGLSAAEARTPAGVAAMERLGRLVGPSSPRGSRLLDRAAGERVRVAPAVLRQAESLLSGEGEGLVEAFLGRLCSQDPALGPALVEALGARPETGGDRLRTLVQGVVANRGPESVN